MRHIQNDIRKFMIAANQECPDKPTLSTEKIRLLRAKLILEEALEQCDALGFCVRMDDGHVSFEENLPTSVDITKIADGIADQIYVSVGTAIALGIDMNPVWEIVQSANMMKFGPGSYKNEHGKQMKPPGWKAPDEAIAKELELQGLPI